MDEQSMPIDIHANKMLDWLISRRHCNKDWMQSLVVIRERVKSALNDMPEHEEIGRVLSKSQLNYFTCLKLVEILKVTEADTKNLFGSYSSQRMKDWQEIIKLYETNSVYLAEAAQVLNRNVHYEVPSLRKQIAKLEQSAEEYQRKQLICVKQSNQFKADYSNSASILGIKGKDVRQELLELLADFPKYSSEIFEQLHQLEEIRQLYQAFLAFINQKDVDYTPVLSHLLTKGNTTYYEYLHGEKPEVIEEFKVDVLSDGSDSNNAGQEEQIDFGDDGGIDFGEETASSEATSGENGDFVHLDKDELELNGNGDEIAWDAGPEVSIIDGANVSKVAKGPEALTLLECGVTRNLLMNELTELDGFLDQRLYEMKQEGDVLSANQFQSAPEALQLTNAKAISAMLAKVRSVFEFMTTDKLKLLYLMKDNPKYVDNAVQKLRHKSELADKVLAKSRLMEEKEAECEAERENLSVRIPPLIEYTKELQSLIASDISKRYKNRPVNIMGGVQVL